MPHRRFRRGIYLFPTMFTVGNLLCGFSSILNASLGRLETAAILIIIAGVMDGLDGRIARLTKTTSDFGLEFDSLADVVSFGVAPGFLVYHWSLHPLGRSGWLLVFLYVVCAAMRLARFNIRASSGSRRYFAGLATPMAAGLLASIAYAFPAPRAEKWEQVLVAAIVVAAAGLMISRIRYRAFKDIDLRHRRSYIYVLAIAVMLAAIVTHTKSTLLVLTVIYAVSGPVWFLWSLVVRVVTGAPRENERGGNVNEVVDGPTTH